MNTLPKLILLLCLIAASAHASTMKEAPKGMYIFSGGKLSATNQAVTSAGTAISNANCDGVRWKVRWSNIEATPDTYTWQYLDDAVAWAAANNKKCGISIDAGTDCPAWLYAAPYSAQSYTLQDTVVSGSTGTTIPVPGDAVFMTRWQKFVTDLGARYDSNPAVSYVIIGGIGNNDEWNIADGFNDTTALGNTLAKVNAWKSSSKQIIDFYMSAFPSTTVMGLPVPPFNPSNAAEDPATSMREVSDYAANTYNCRFAYSVARLQSSTTTSNYLSANELFLHWTTNPTHGETLYTASSPDDFNATLHVALDLKIRGMETYKVDFQNAALQNFIVGSGTYAGEAGGITPRRADMLAIPAPTPCPTPTPTPTPTATPTPTPTPANHAPIVNAGPDQIVATHSTGLSGSATDDELPNPPGTLTYIWSKANGPGSVTFGNAQTPATTATFSVGGTYTLKLSASDGALTGTDTVVLTVNKFPVVNAGPDQTITLPDSATLNGSATDDGIPSPPAALTYTWSKVSGPGTVTFGNVHAASTTASFSASGSYSLKLAASDSVFTGTDRVLVTVNPSTSPTADLNVKVADGKTTIVAGTQNTYTITVTNTGPVAVTSASVIDTFPSIFTGVTFTATQSGGATGFAASGIGNINDTVDMPSGSKITYTAKGKVSSDATGNLSNTAQVTAPNGVLDPNTANNSATDSDSITFKVDLKVTITDGKTAAVAGTKDTYTIVVTNAGPSNVSGAVIGDTFPTTFTDVTFTAVQTGGATGFTTVGSGDITDAVTMPANSKITYKATGTISASATGTLSDTATVTAPNGSTDPNPVNNSATDNDTL